jgi:hypothetical protein
MKKVKWILLIVFCLMLVSCGKDADNNPPVDEVSIIFNTGSSDLSVETKTGLPGETVAMPAVPSRNGYRFSHWELNGTQYAFTVYPASTIILNAVWEKLYNVYFEVGDHHEPVEQMEKLEDESLDDFPVLSYKIDNEGKGYKFLYWTYEGVELPFDKMPEMDLLLEAKWEESILISFDTGSAEEVIEPIFAAEDEDITAPKEIPSIDNRQFIGWSYQGEPFIFDKMPAQSIRLVAQYITLADEYNALSSLPKMFINLEDNFPLDGVDRENYVNTSVTIQGSSDEDLLAAMSAELKGRGHGSWTDSGPKRGYNLKFFSKQSLFGEAKSKQWALLAGSNFYDPTLAKNATAFNMARDVFSNIEYTTSTHWLELYVNGEYRGVYLLVEKIKVDANRVNIDAQYGVLDTGYLLEYNVYAPEDGPEGLAYFKVAGYKYPVSVSEPDPADFLSEGITESVFRSQVQYIKDYTTIALQAAINKNLNTFMEYADINSFIDMYLLHELFKNSDTGWSSFYMYKKPSGKLYAGPAWDFDCTAGKNRGDTSPTGFFVSDTITQTSQHTASELYISLMQIPEFRQMVGQRWHAISANVKTFINGFLSDGLIADNQFAFGRNYKFWSDQGPDYGSYPNMVYAQEKWGLSVIELRNWLISRSEWFDSAFN